jgi:hypothetical protein
LATNLVRPGPEFRANDHNVVDNQSPSYVALRPNGNPIDVRMQIFDTSGHPNRDEDRRVEIAGPAELTDLAIDDSGNFIVVKSVPTASVTTSANSFSPIWSPHVEDEATSPAEHTVPVFRGQTAGGRGGRGGQPCRRSRP